VASLLKKMNCHNKKVSRSFFFDQLELFPMNDLLTWLGHINAFCCDSNQTLQGTQDVGIENNPNLQFLIHLKCAYSFGRKSSIGFAIELRNSDVWFIETENYVFIKGLLHGLPHEDKKILLHQGDFLLLHAFFIISHVTTSNYCCFWDQ